MSRPGFKNRASIPETYEAFHDKNPSPSCFTGKPAHLHQTIGEDTSESECNTANHVKGRISLADVVYTRLSTLSRPPYEIFLHREYHVASK
ncbi:MAG: hypothetical protein Q9222_007823 [Ikaeria aurantiellina]